MAWLELRGKTYRINFRHRSRHDSRSLKTGDPGKAEASKCRLEETLSDLERGRLEIPPGADLVTFLLSDGKLTQRPKEVQLADKITLGELRDRYLQTHSNGAMEVNSLDTVRLHLRHFDGCLGKTSLWRTWLSTICKATSTVARKRRGITRGRSARPPFARK